MFSREADVQFGLERPSWRKKSHDRVNLFAEDVEKVVKKFPYLVVRREDVVRGTSRLKSPDVYRGLGDCEGRGAVGVVVNLLSV